MEQVAPKDYLEDEIDIRGIVNTLLRHKWLILAVSLFLAVTAFAFSKLILPKQYQATALVILTKPIFSTNLDIRIEASPELPDAKSLTDLTRADDLLVEMIQAPEAGQLIPEEDRNPEMLRKRLQVALIGLNQLRLDVIDTDPQRAADLANLWAKLVTARLNNLFYVNDITLGQIEQQRILAYQKWANAEQALLVYLPDNRVNTLEVNLGQARARLLKYLEKMNQIDLLISDINLFDSRLAGEGQQATLSLQDALSLITLQQRSVGGENVVQVQAAGPDILEANYTIAKARKNMKVLVESLSNQRNQLQAELEKEDRNISALATELEEAKYRLIQLTMGRDFALSAYQALASQEEETRISLAQDDQVVKVASQAVPPQEDVGPHSVVNGVVAGALGFILTVVSIFTLDWWRSTSASVPRFQAERKKLA